MTLARSLQNRITQLHHRRGRDKHGRTLAEGVRLVEEALAAEVPLDVVLVAPGLEATPRGQALAAGLRAAGARVEPVTDRELAELAATEHPQGVLAVVTPRTWRLDDLPADRPVLVLDGVQDPGNVGTLLRTAWALGAGGVVALPGTVEFTNPKVLRASMGGCFRVPGPAVSVEEWLAWMERYAMPLWTTATEGEPVGPASGPVAVVVGNEGAGVSAAVAARASRRVAVPLRAGAESLNVAVAAGIILYEVLREH